MNDKQKERERKQKERRKNEILGSKLWPVIFLRPEVRLKGITADKVVDVLFVAEPDHYPEEGFCAENCTLGYLALFQLDEGFLAIQTRCDTMPPPERSVALFGKDCDFLIQRAFSKEDQLRLRTLIETA